MTGEQLAAAAETLVGSPFRLHGRDPATGLDCIGVLSAALARAGMPGTLPNSYPLRSRSIPATAAIAECCGFGLAHGQFTAGDVAICKAGPCQLHLAIALGAHRFIHAHAGLRRVVFSPAPLPWPILQHWRLQTAV